MVGQELQTRKYIVEILSVLKHLRSSQPVSSKMPQVQQFYVGRHIFITGGTGFLGLILTEKLLRSCPEIGTIYLLIREKKGKSVQERIDALLVNPIFNVLRNEYPDFSKKVVAVAGDITAEGLGLSVGDYARIVNEVSVIFHLAATVRFTERLDIAVKFNVNSVKYIVDIAKACKNLEAGVYVSTAYSNCVRKSINEEFYPPPLSYEQVTNFMEDVKTKNWSEQAITDYAEKVLGDWPNTYTFTKAIAEGVVAEFANEMPFAVFRPSIVMTTYAEPISGWVSSPLGFSGLICAIGLGLVHVLLLDDNARFDIVPVDYVCNSLISCVWEIASTKRRPNEDIPVYNYVSGSGNPISCKKFCDNVEILGRVYPTNSAIYYPGVVRTTSKRIFTILEFFFHLIPALMIDSVGRLFGKQLRLYNIERKIGDAQRALGYFVTRQWDFENQRIQNLWKRMSPEDRRIYQFSMKDVDWDEYIMRMIRGLRKYMVGDRDGNEEESRRRHVYLYIVHVVVRLALGIFVTWVIWKLFSGIGALIGV